MSFDPANAKGIALGPYGYERCFARDYEKSKSVGGLASCARADINQAVECLLVNLDEPAEKLLRGARDWLRIAITENEKPQHYFAEATEASRYRDLALCDWLLHGRHDPQALERSVEHRDRYFANCQTIDRVGAGYEVAAYLDAGAFQRALALLNAARALNPPKSPGKTASEAQMGYVICKHKLDGTYSEAEVAEAARTFLKRHIDGWLTDGHYADAGQWLKVLHWNDSDRAATPKEIVMKCYDYLPGRAPPA